MKQNLGHAWAAGFFDGEGSISCSTHLTLSVSQVDQRPLYRLFGLFGGSIYGPALNNNPFSRKPIYRWRANGEVAVMALVAMYPYLTTKQDEANLAMKWPSGKWNRVPEDVAFKRRKIVADIAAIKATKDELSRTVLVGLREDSSAITST